MTNILPGAQVEIQDALVIFFVSAQTWLVPLEGYLADRFGPRKLLIGGGVLAALGWVINAHTGSLAVLNFAQVLAGCGSGIVYSISIGNALKWFPDRRGLAAGLTAAAFAVGSAATVLPMGYTIREAGYEAAFLWFGVGQGLVIVLASLIMRFPGPARCLPPLSPRSFNRCRDYAPREMLRCREFWLIYAMMAMGAVPGLLMIGQLKPLAKDFDVAETRISLFGLTLLTVELALVIDRVMGGVTRPVFGWLSDRIGREVAIFLAFTLEGGSLLLLLLFGHDPILFVLMSGLAFFGWGAVFSLFPAVSGDMFGRTFATTNYSLLYTAKGAAGLMVALCNRLQAHTGSWDRVFAVMIAFDWLAALLALLVLRPCRARLAKMEADQHET